MYRLIRAALLWPVAGIVGLSFTAANAEMLKGYPDAIICNSTVGLVVLYIAGVTPDGTGVYKALSQNAAHGTMTSDHIFHRDGLKDCDGKSADQLEKEGKTRTFQ